MQAFGIIFLLVPTALMLVSQALEEIDSQVVITNCRLHGALPDVSSPMYAHIIGIVDGEAPSYSDATNESVYCGLYHEEDPLNLHVKLELFLEEIPPSHINLQSGPFYLPALPSTALMCTYNDISRIANITDDPSSEITRFYNCEDIEDFKIILTETITHTRTKRSPGTVPREKECAKFSGNHTGKHYDRLGEKCYLTDGSRGRRMFNEDGDPDCLLCCADHYWSLKCEECQECEPGSTQPKSNFWTTCDHINSKVETPDTPTQKPTSEPEPKQPEQPTIDEPIKQPALKPPTKIPENLQVVKATPTWAIINWKEVPSTTLEPVDKYWIELKNSHSSDNFDLKYFEDRGCDKWYNMTQLNPKSCYEVKVRAANSAGNSTWSDTIDVHTTRHPPPLKGAYRDQQEDQITVTWDPQPDDEDLKVAVEFWLGNQEAYKITRPNPRGRITFVLPLVGTYKCRSFYFNDEGPGPYFDFEVTYTGKALPDTHPVVRENRGNGHMIGWALLGGVFLGLVLSFVLILLYLLRNELATLCTGP